MQIPGYTIIKKINSGGMATVYLATQHSVGRTVALKVMKPALDKDPEFHQRFQREANIVGQLSHPNIIPIYDIGRHEELNYISMEFLPKGSLEEKIRKGINIESALKVTLGIAAALEWAHSKGYVHRDIKPENILFREDDSPVLTDFGIARTIKSKVNMTQVGTIVGTPNYMSPEQAKGEQSDGRADLYSLGVVLFEMLTGQKPFHADSSLALGIKHIHEQAPKLPSNLFFLQPVLDKLLAKKPEQRFQSAKELITELQLLDGNSLLLGGAPGKTSSLQWLKTLGLLLKQDASLLTHKLSRHYKTAKNKFNTKAKEQPIISAPASQHTLIATRIASAPLIDNDASSNTSNHEIFADNRHKRYWVYSSIVVLFIFIIANNIVPPESNADTASRWETLMGNKKTPAKDTSTTEEESPLAFTVTPSPASARIRILNIKEKYAPGIMLPSGAYHIEVSHPGYTTKTKWIRLNEKNQILDVALQKAVQITDQAQLPLPEMVQLAGGNFLMGNANSTDENTTKPVSIESDFLISRYEITFNEYDFFALATNRALPDDMGWGRGERPVINISWDDAIAYANWLSKTTGKNYRLPTAAEWEYAARGNTTGSYWWGNNKDDAPERANCRYGCKSLWGSFLNNETRVVGSFPPNDFGIHDTAGNIAEWINDCADKVARQSCLKRAVRGGSFVSNVESITAYSQIAFTASKSRKSIGFRLAQDIPQQQIRDAVQSGQKPRRRSIFRDISDSIFNRD
ncbi:MAG: bifunctional serine/threonine-protein kinase/formylglycine-generating enzyme family protein [Cellvibrio sp.]|uniref:bifunctional serine/threonine-protein kinase/formylglycine-generating enzyme family protein n=1 Tax=Cellvibrio sp. TaxID=1965322 RepID=UPI0031AC41A2